MELPENGIAEDEGGGAVCRVPHVSPLFARHGRGSREGRPLRAYARPTDANSCDCFPGASATRAPPMMLNTAAATSRPVRSFARWIAMTAITAPCAKLDHAAKA